MSALRYTCSILSTCCVCAHIHIEIQMCGMYLYVYTCITHVEIQYLERYFFLHSIQFDIK